MTPQHAIEWYEGRGALATACDVTEAAVYLWVKNGFIPYDKQCQIQVDTQRSANGKKPLQASWYDVPEDRRPENMRSAA